MEETRPNGERTVGAVPRDELIDLNTIMLAVRRNWILILLVSVAVLLATAVIYYSTQPTYVATAKVMVDRVPDEVVRPANPDQPVIPADSPTVDTAVAVLESPSLLGQVVDRLKLTEHPEFNPELASQSGRPAMASAARDRAIRILAAGLDVEREGVSYAIAINYVSPDPTVAAAVANDVMAAYLDRQRENRSAHTERAARLLGGRLEDLRQEVLAAESAVADYRARHQLFAASQDSSITQQQLSVLDAELASSRAAQAMADARRAAVQGGRSPDAIQEALDSTVVSGLRQQRAQLSAAAAELAARYGERHPDRVKAERQVADIDRQIQAEIRRVASSVSTEAGVARQRTASIAGSIGQLQGRLAADNAASVRLNELERHAESSRAIYQALLDNYRQALARQGTESSGATAISEAQVPVLPSEPNPLMYLVLGILAAGALSGLAVLIAESRRGAVVAA
ncbi:GumC family protein [Sphingosinicella sp. CPCC 101087]|uniref:GumC family protein n=1 Tax=Sphingosinicella sp. CPCC 101087 TaxID=2497754 RepID=UPI001FB0C0A1|nr:GumC family protein [Sphingosinicella sp. CPCC 101087]